MHNPRLVDLESHIYTCKCGQKYLKSRGKWMKTCLECLKEEDYPKFLATSPYISPASRATESQRANSILNIKNLVGDDVVLGAGDVQI